MASQPDLSYPIGRPELDVHPTAAQRQEMMDAVEHLPGELRAAVTGLNEAQLETPYRPGGWTVRQVVHHVPDSHLNAYVRCKLALTEPEPTIKVYDQALWANLPDSRAPIELSLRLLENLHPRWVLLLRSLEPAQWERKLLHPEQGRITLGQVLGLYAWHGRHHTAHITALRARQGW